MKPHFEIHHLEQFVAVARAKNFTKAAEKLKLSQSALSRSVQKLEEQIGQPLFERMPREVTLTDLGELFLERAKEILHLVDDTASLLSDAARHGRIRLGAIPTIAPYLLPDLLRSFCGEHSDIKVVVQEDTTENLIRRCSHGQIDLAILALPLVVRHLETEALFEEELLLTLPPGHPLCECESITAETAETYPFILLNEEHCLSGNIETFCQQQSVQPVSIERINQLATVQELVALGHGVSLLPEMARRLDTSDRRVYRSFTDARPTRTIAMMWNPYRYQSKWTKMFMDHLRQRTRQ